MPKGCVIHHRDMNPSNNNINNLVLMPESYHKMLHGKIQFPKGIKIGDKK